MLNVIVPKDLKKLKAQIKALEYQISVDTNSKDRQAHKEALKRLMKEKEGRKDDNL